MSAEEVLTAFRRDAPYLFLGAAFAAVGMVSAAFAVLRRQRDSAPHLLRIVCRLVRASPVDFVAHACNDGAGFDLLRAPAWSR